MSAIFEAQSMPIMHGLSTRGDKADGAAIGIGGRFTIDGFADDKYLSILLVKEPALGVDFCSRNADCLKRRVIKFARLFDIVSAKNDVPENRLSPYLQTDSVPVCTIVCL
ncbi:hypothetical protein GRI39_09205 [Altererythrobacter indicus]|uniref:Uncharacterized protein n=1 Tax=Altericroceibacterium indicum TaxID=374177 RepID=A0A845A760_9SPHN|nr:hypothetical protein [Altericroceibacterium indicum]MXP26212.1 hypothetical protein [Altericroceibacterium indicum]